MQNFNQKPPLLYKYPAPTKDVILNINNTILKNPEFYIKICHLMNIMDLPIPFKPCLKKLRFLSQVLNILENIFNNNKPHFT